jgi:UDP-N-acetylmuramate dehydrogenase
MLTMRDTDLTAINTFGIAARAHTLHELHSPEDVEQLIATGEPFTVVGGGSNIVLAGDPKQAIALMRLRGRRLVREDDDAWLVEAMAGESWHDFVVWALEMGWPGLENLSLIPGTVGAAPVQNIGAYGVELCERFESLEAIAVGSGERRTFRLAECGFGYRDSVFKRQPGAWVILSVTLRLPRPWRPVLGYKDLRELLAADATPSPQRISNAVMQIRRSKLPDWTEIGNAGSFFKNPVVSAAELGRMQRHYPGIVQHRQADGRAKLAAGWLIEAAGWKGRTLGAAGVHDKQALVLVNRGGATGADILALAEEITRDVASKFGVTLEREPVIL